MSSKRPPRLLIDLDSTTAVLAPKWFREIRETFGDGPDPDQPAPVWDVWRLSSGGHGVYEILKRPGFFRDLPVMPGARRVLRRLVRQGFEVVFVSHTDPWNYADKYEWMRRLFPFVPAENFVGTARKELVEGDVLFDDAPHVLEAALAVGRQVVAMDYPYNRHLAVPRVRSWAEFEALVPLLVTGAEGAVAGD